MLAVAAPYLGLTNLSHALQQARELAAVTISRTPSPTDTPSTGAACPQPLRRWVHPLSNMGGPPDVPATSAS
jgi:hypothetical protein